MIQHSTICIPGLLRSGIRRILPRYLFIWADRSADQYANTIANATGKPIHYQTVTIEEYAAILTSHGVPEAIVSLVT